MSETQKKKDLTAQLAQWVREEWTRRHLDICGMQRFDGGWHKCDGTMGTCLLPKPSALVAYEQAQQAQQDTDSRCNCGVRTNGAPQHKTWCATSPYTHRLRALASEFRVPSGSLHGEALSQTIEECAVALEMMGQSGVHADEPPKPTAACDICHELRPDVAGEKPDLIACVNCGESQADCLSGLPRCCGECRHRAGASYRAPSEPKTAHAAPALAYVLTMQRRNDQVTLVLRDYADRARAEDSRRLLEEIADGSHITYRVHAVPRVE